MPSQRSKDQRGVLVMMDKDFREEIDRALPIAGYSDRSQFIRDAVYKRLQEIGIDVPAHLKAAPSRIGKGGRKSKVTVSVTQHVSGSAKHVHQQVFSAAQNAPKLGQHKSKGEKRIKNKGV